MQAIDTIGVQDGASVLARSESRFAGSQHASSRGASSVSLGTALKNPAPCTLAPHTFISPPRESQPLFSQPSNSRAGGGDGGGGGGLLSGNDGLLGPLAAGGRELPILVPGGAESRDAFCTGVSQGALCLLAHAGAGDDHNSMHAVLEHSRQGHLGNAFGASIHDAAEAHPSVASRPALFEGTQILEKCHEDSQVGACLYFTWCMYVSTAACCGQTYLASEFSFTSEIRTQEAMHVQNICAMVIFLLENAIYHHTDPGPLWLLDSSRGCFRITHARAAC